MAGEGIPLSGVGKVTGLFSRLAPRRGPTGEPAPAEAPGPAPAPMEPDAVVPTKALKKFMAALHGRPSPTLLDLGPVVGANVEFFGEQFGCKLFIGDILAQVERFDRQHPEGGLPAFLEGCFPQETASVDGILCWDVFDFLDKPSARAVADQLMRVLKADGALFGFFATETPAESRLSKFVVVDDGTLRHRWHGSPRQRRHVMQNRDIITLFERLRVSDSFLLQTKVREVLFRKPAYLAGP
jgi:hypothetical protein